MVSNHARDCFSRNQDGSKVEIIVLIESQRRIQSEEDVMESSRVSRIRAEKWRIEYGPRLSGKDRHGTCDCHDGQPPTDDFSGRNGEKTPFFHHGHELMGARYYTNLCS